MRKGIFIFWSLFIAAAAFRVWQSRYIQVPDIGPCFHGEVRGEGAIQEEPVRNDSGQSLVIAVESLSLKGDGTQCPNGFKIKIKTKLYPQFSLGEHVSFVGKLLSPMNFNEADGRVFDYRGYLSKDDIFYEMKSAIVIQTSSTLVRSPVASFYGWIEIVLLSIKTKFVAVLNQTLGEPHAALASGLVVGEKAALGTKLLDDFRKVGLIHIVVLSGYNITIVGSAIRRLLAFLPRVWGIFIGGICIALFGVLVGGGATVVRSCFMAGVALSADMIRREYDVARALIFAGLIMLIQNPLILLHDPSFQLSFLATLGLILFAGPIEKHLGFITEKFEIRGVVASTLATQISVAPYILYMMGQISIIGMFVNILVLPFIPITMAAIALAGFSGMLYLPIGQGIAWIVHILLSYELFMVRNFAKLPFAAAHIAPFSMWWVAVFYGVLVFAVAILKLWKRFRPAHALGFPRSRSS